MEPGSKWYPHTSDRSRSRLTIVAGVLDEMVQEPELAIGEICDDRTHPGLAPREVEDQRACTHDVVVALGRMPAHVHPDPGDELVERERLREVVACAKPEAP